MISYINYITIKMWTITHNTSIPQPGNGDIFTTLILTDSWIFVKKKGMNLNLIRTWDSYSLNTFRLKFKSKKNMIDNQRNNNNKFSKLPCSPCSDSLNGNWWLSAFAETRDSLKWTRVAAICAILTYHILKFYRSQMVFKI